MLIVRYPPGILMNLNGAEAVVMGTLVTVVDVQHHGRLWYSETDPRLIEVWAIRARFPDSPVWAECRWHPAIGERYSIHGVEDPACTTAQFEAARKLVNYLRDQLDPEWRGRPFMAPDEARSLIVEAMVTKGKTTVAAVLEHHNISKKTFDRWRKRSNRPLRQLQEEARQLISRN